MKHLGTRWLSPSYLELCEGPWGVAGDFGFDVVKSWHAAIDWHVDHGLDTIIGDIALSRSDAVYLGWGFHYILSFKGQPYEEELFSEDFRSANVATLKAIFAYAKARGVRCFAQHFNFLAPRRMAFARGWTVRYPSNADMGGNVPDRLGLLVQNCRWSNAEYQEFMTYCWQETLRTLPGLTGFLVTFGEPTYGLYNLKQRGDESAGPGLENDFPSRYYADERFVENAVDFAEKFSKAVTDAGGTPMIRAWGIQWARHRMPKVADYVVKYQLFDCIDAGPDPVVSEWVKAGHRVWAEAEIIGENAGPILWTSPEYFERIARDVATLGLEGFVTHVNSIFEPASLNTPAKYVNLELIFAALNGDRAPALRERAVEILNKSYPLAAKVCEALEKISVGVLNFSRVIHRCDEGYCFGWTCSILPVNSGYCSVILADGTPPEWCREGLIAFKEYLDFLAIRKYTPGCLDDLRGDRECPIRLMQRAEVEARSAKETLHSLASQIPSDRTLADLALGAAMTECMACEMVATLAALLDYYAAKRCVDLDTQKELATRCLEAFKESRIARARLREYFIQLSQEHFACGNTQHQLIDFMRQGYEQFCVESAFYEKECDELLTGKTWTMSGVEINWRGINSLGPIQAPWRLLEAANLPRLKL